MIAKIDAYSVMLYNTTIRKVLKRFDAPVRFLEDDRDPLSFYNVAADSKAYVSNGTIKVLLHFPFMRLSLPISVFREERNKLTFEDFKSSKDEKKLNRFLDLELDSVRVEMQGTELDMLRIGYGCPALVPEDCFTDPTFWTAETAFAESVTRVDFAYDFLDLQDVPGGFETLPKDLCKFVTDSYWREDSGYRFSTKLNKPGGVSCSPVITTSETTARLGRDSGHGGRHFVRFYDKHQEQRNKHGVPSQWPIWYNADYSNSLTWIRYEYQTRTTKSQEYIYLEDKENPGSFIHGDAFMAVILRRVLPEFCICEKKGVPFKKLDDFIGFVERNFLDVCEKKILCNWGKAIRADLSKNKLSRVVSEIAKMDRFADFYDLRIIQNLSFGGLNFYVKMQKHFDYILNAPADDVVAQRKAAALDSRMKSIEACFAEVDPNHPLADRRNWPGLKEVTMEDGRKRLILSVDALDELLDYGNYDGVTIYPDYESVSSAFVPEQVQLSIKGLGGAL